MDAFDHLSDDKKIQLCHTMLLSRYFEEKVNEMFMKGLIHGTTHLGIGQEANHAGVSAALKADDWILATHRGHGHFIGKGGSTRTMMAELFGLKDGVCNGLGGSMHLADIKNHNMGSSGVVGGALPLAVGMAFAIKYQNKNDIVLSFLGDGAANQGMSLESFNLASVWSVPVIFYCENNLYGMSAPAEKFLGGGNIPLRAEAFGIKNLSIDGNNVIEIYNAVSKAAEYVRQEGRPFLIESKTYRWLGHSKSDLRKYRTKEEEESWKGRCPILCYAKYLIEHSILTETEFEEMKKNAFDQIEQDVKWCMGKEILSLDEAMTYVYYNETHGGAQCL